jgi:hypoxanthine phosphoribosyltransferase
MRSNKEIHENKISLTYEEIDARLSAFNFPELDLIVGIASGGLVPAQLIAGKLHLPLKKIVINYRKENNQPRYGHPRLIKSDSFPAKNLRILLVDDVSVSGKTMQKAKEILRDQIVRTFVLKGLADYVLFPEIGSCVNWPWHN